MRRRPPRIAAIAGSVLLAASSLPAEEVEDLYFGEALYYAHQERYFDALERLDAEIAQYYRVDERELDSLRRYIDDAEFSVGDFELHYRMHHRAGRAIRAVLEANVEETVRNEAAYRLARIHFHKGQFVDALRVLDRIEGEVAPTVADDIAFLRANVHLALGQPAEATELLREIQGAPELEGFTAYNLGIALLQAGELAEAARQLDKAGRIRGSDRATLAIRDKSNLVLGSLLLESEQWDLAQRSLDRVRLAGPFSNQALLRAGRADASAENYKRALVPLGILAKREATDAAVQEAKLALPYAYGQLEVHGRAAVLYHEAVNTFANELSKLDASIENIRSGDFLEALVREEIRQDKDWVIRLRSLPDAPETYYLMSLMASHDFQTGLQNYLDLEDMRKRMVAWQRSLNAFEDVIEHRRVYYEPLLPGIDREFRKLDAQMRLRLEQRDHLEKRLAQMLVQPRPDYLVTSEEHAIGTRIARLEAAVFRSKDPQVESHRERLARLSGVLRWDVEMQYHERLTRTHENLAELSEHVEAMKARYDAFVRARQAATHSYVGYEETIRDLRARVKVGMEQVAELMKQQGSILETVAIDELRRRRERLEAYQNQARFAAADSYDRAAKAQAE